MDRQELLFVVPEVVLEMKREEKRLMAESLRADEDALLEKVREHSMRKRKLQDMLAIEEARQKLVDDFMVFDGAIKNGDLEIAQNFDEKAMMNTILTMMNCDGSDNGGLACVYGGDFPKIGLDLENATMETIAALVNSYHNCGGDNGGFASDYGDDVPKIGPALKEKATMDKTVATVTNDVSCCGDNGGFAGDYGEDFPKIKLWLEEKATMDTMVAMVNSDGSCAGNNGGFAVDYGSEEGMKAAVEGTNTDGSEG